MLIPVRDWTPQEDGRLIATKGRYVELDALATAWDIPMQAVLARFHRVRGSLPIQARPKDERRDTATETPKARACKRTLPEALLQRRASVMRLSMSGFSPKEIAAKLGMNVNTVYWDIRAAKAGDAQG